MQNNVNITEVARMLGLHQATFSNYKAWKNGDESRRAYLSDANIQKIEEAMKLSKAAMALKYLASGHTLTPMQSMNFFGLHSLSQQVTKWRARGIDVRNIVPEEQKFHTHAIYALFINGERIKSGEQK